MVARQYLLKGRVQGVGFRYFVYRYAQSRKIGGWVKNLADGTVEIHAEGDQESMDLFLDQIRSGPSFAFVDDIQIREIPAEGLQGFSIVT